MAKLPRNLGDRNFRPSFDQNQTLSSKRNGLKHLWLLYYVKEQIINIVWEYRQPSSMLRLSNRIYLHLHFYKDIYDFSEGFRGDRIKDEGGRQLDKNN